MRLFTPFAVLGLVFCLVVDLSAQSVRVVFVSGQAELQRPEEPALRPAVKGETVIIGTRIVTGADGRLVLTPMPGIKSIVTPNTTLLLETATETRTSATNLTQTAVLDLKQGAVVSDLQKSEGVSYDYSIRTARGLAGARGTTYTVGITPAGVQTIVVAHGTIALSFPDGRKGSLAPGQLSVTKANGTTQQVSNVTQLSPDDKKGAQSVTETTVVAIASAVDSGIAVAPEAMKNTVAAAQSLGVTLSPEASAAAASALEKPPAKQDKEEAQSKEDKGKDDKKAESKEAQKSEAKSPDQSPPPAADQPPAAADTPAPSLFNTLGQLNVTQPPPVGVIKPTDVISQTATDPVASFRALLTATQQSGFDALPGPVKLQLANRKNLSFAAFVISLPAAQLAPFFQFSAPVQTQLAARNVAALTSLAIHLTEAQVTALLQLSIPTQNQVVAQGTPGFAAFALQLTEPQINSLLARPAPIQNQFVTLNDVDLAAFALTHLDDNGFPLLDEDIRTYLDATLNLPATSRLFLKELAGPGFVNIASTPDPRQWTAAAFARTVTSWNALDAGQRNQIISLGAGEAIMDTSADYIQALLNARDTTKDALITELGWGRYLNDLAGKPTGTTVLSIANGLTPDKRTVIKLFDISPDRLTNAATTAAITALANPLLTDQTTLPTLLQIGVGERMVNENNTTTNFGAVITSALGFYNGLTPDEKTAARAIGLGYIFYKFAPSATIPSLGSTTALQRVEELTSFYIANPSLRSALQESGVLAFEGLPLDFINAITSATGSHKSIATTLADYNALHPRTRLFLANSGHEGQKINFYELANPLYAPGSTSSPLRPLSAINGILTGLTPPEFSTLLEIGGSRALLIEDIDPNTSGTQDPLRPVFFKFDGTDATDPAINTPLQTLQNLIASYNELNAAHPYVMRELGIVGEGNIAALGADTAGLMRLVTAYDAAGGGLRAKTERLDENNVPAAGAHFGDSNTSGARSFFFNQGNSAPVIIQNVQFESGGDLYVGATRFLKINNSGLSFNPAFTVGSGNDLYLHAADLIDLTGDTENRNVFSADIRSITMAAATINLTNVNFPEGSVASLNSKLGGVNFGAVKIPGRVNFQNVTYGGQTLFQVTGQPSLVGGARGNIAIGTLTTPAPMPTYTAPPTPPPPPPPPPLN